MSIRKDYPATAALVALAIVTLAMCVAYVAIIVIVFGKMFDAADDGDMPHTIAWGVVLLSLGLGSVSFGSRTKRDR